MFADPPYAIEDREVNEWVENYTVSFAEIKADEATAGNPSDEEIKAFFAKRRSELKVEPRRATLVASVLSTQLLTKAAQDEALKAELEKLTGITGNKLRVDVEEVRQPDLEPGDRFVHGEIAEGGHADHFFGKK